VTNPATPCERFYSDDTLRSDNVFRNSDSSLCTETKDRATPSKNRPTCKHDLPNNEWRRIEFHSPRCRLKCCIEFVFASVFKPTAPT